MSSALFFIVLCSWQNFNAALNLGNLSIAPPPELLWLACFLTSWPQTKDVELTVNQVLIGKESLPTKKAHQKTRLHAKRDLWYDIASTGEAKHSCKSLLVS